MENSLGSSTIIEFSKNPDEGICDVKSDVSKVLIKTENGDKEKPVLISRKTTTAENIFAYVMCFALSFVIGYSFTSYALIASHGLRDYSQGFFDNYHELFSNLCPAVLYFGSTLSTFGMLMIKRYSHLKVLQTSIAIFFFGYLLQVFYPHILVIFLARFLIGIASGASCMVVPQVLYFNCKDSVKGLFTSFFPFFILIGLTSAVALIPSVTPEIYPYFNAIPLGLTLISFLCSFGSFKLTDVNKEKGFIEVTKYMFSANAVKSTVSVILTHFFQKTTGVDFIGNFSGSLFSGENAQIYSLSPLIVAALATIVTAFLPDIFGRKLPIVTCLSLISLVTLSMGIWGTNVISLILFTIVYNAGLGAIPFYYQNETVPKKYIPDINEIGTFSNVLLALFVALYAAFLISPSNTTIWFTFCGLSVLGAITMGLTMPETKGTPIEERSFISSWFNLPFKNKNT